MLYRNDLEKAYQLYERPLDRDDLYHLFFSGYDAMIEERKKRVAMTTGVCEADSCCTAPEFPVPPEEEEEELGELVRYGEPQAEIDFYNNND